MFLQVSDQIGRNETLSTTIDSFNKDNINWFFLENKKTQKKVLVREIGNNELMNEFKINEDILEELEELSDAIHLVMRNKEKYAISR